jgi:hypothetical protein
MIFPEKRYTSFWIVLYGSLAIKMVKVEIRGIG